MGYALNQPTLELEKFMREVPRGHDGKEFFLLKASKGHFEVSIGQGGEFLYSPRDQIIVVGHVLTSPSIRWGENPVYVAESSGINHQPS